MLIVFVVVGICVIIGVQVVSGVAEVADVVLLELLYYVLLS